MNQGHLKNISHMSLDGYLMIGNGTRDKNRAMRSVSVKCRKLIRPRAYKKDSAFNPSTCVCGCDKNSETDEYLKDMESLDIPGKSCWWCNSYLWYDCGYRG